jgi:hypothetical protein
MTPTLRPMSLGEILDRTFHIYRSRFLVFLTIGLASPIASLALTLLGEIGKYTTLSSSTNDTIMRINSWMPNDWVASFVHFLSWPVIAHLTSRTLLGEKPTLVSALDSCKTRWRSWLALTGILWAVCALLPNTVSRWYLARALAASARDLFRNGAPSSPNFAVIGFLQWAMDLLLILAVSMSVPVWKVEELGVLSSLRKGWTLAKGIRIRILAAQLLASLLEWLLYVSFVLVAGVALQIAIKSFHAGELAFQLRYDVAFVAIKAASVLVAAIYPIALTLFYYDQRIRHEGYDIEQMMEAAGLNPTITPTLAEQPVDQTAAQEDHA